MRRYKAKKSGGFSKKQHSKDTSNTDSKFMTDIMNNKNLNRLANSPALRISVGLVGLGILAIVVATIITLV